MARVRKGDTVRMGRATGTVLCTSVNKLFVDFGDGFTCLVSRSFLEKKG